MRRVVIVLLILAAAGTGAAIALGMFDRTVSHRDQVTAVLTQLGDGRAGQVYDDASPAFRRTTVRDKFLSLAGQIQSTLGKFESLGPIEDSRPTATDDGGDTVRVIAPMVFEHGATRGEVSLIQDGDQWRLLGLSIEIPKSLRAKAEALRTDYDQVKAPPEVLERASAVLQQSFAGDAAVVHAASARSFREAVDLARFTRLIAGQQAVLGKFVRVMAIISSSQNLARTRSRVDALLEFERGMTTGRLEFVRVPAGASEREPAAPETDWQLGTFKIVVPEPVMPE